MLFACSHLWRDVTQCFCRLPWTQWHGCDSLLLRNKLIAFTWKVLWELARLRVAFRDETSKASGALTVISALLAQHTYRTAAAGDLEACTVLWLFSARARFVTRLARRKWFAEQLYYKNGAVADWVARVGALHCSLRRKCAPEGDRIKTARKYSFFCQNASHQLSTINYTPKPASRFFCFVCENFSMQSSISRLAFVCLWRRYKESPCQATKLIINNRNYFCSQDDHFAGAARRSQAVPRQATTTAEAGARAAPILVALLMPYCFGVAATAKMTRTGTETLDLDVSPADHRSTTRSAPPATQRMRRKRSKMKTLTRLETEATPAAATIALGVRRSWTTLINRRRFSERL